MLRSFRNILKPLAKNCDLWNIHRFLFLRVRRYRFTENDFFKCRKLIPNMFIFWWPVIKAAQKVYFTHHSCRVIIWFDTGLYKSATSTYSFGKLVFCLSVLCVFCLFCFEFDVTFIDFIAFCVIIFHIVPSVLWSSSHFVKIICKNKKIVL